jgi:flagellar basal-body rod protein FlgG
MVKGIYETSRSLQAKMQKMNIVANNIANINTAGYKSELPFSEVIYKEGKSVIKQLTDYQQGQLLQTQNPLDVAISGKGFFSVKTDSGIQLTRAGNFKLSDDGYLVTEDGARVQGDRGDINLNDFMLDQNQTFTISKTGEIKVGDNIVTNLKIVQPVDPDSLMRVDSQNFSSAEGYKPVSDSEYTVKQGYIEGSNSNPITEMQQMIQISSEYQSAHKVMNFLDTSLGQANEIGKV